MSSKLMCTRREAANSLSVSLRFVDTLIAKKQLVVRRVGRRVLVPLTSLERFARIDHILPPETADPGRPSRRTIANASELGQVAKQDGGEGFGTAISDAEASATGAQKGVARENIR